MSKGVPETSEGNIAWILQKIQKFSKRKN